MTSYHRFQNRHQDFGPRAIYETLRFYLPFLPHSLIFAFALHRVLQLF